MSSDTMLLATLWVTAGTFVGGTVTPLIAERRRINEWLATLVGIVLGGIGSVILLAPYWLLLRSRPTRTVDGPAWQQDALTPEEVAAILETETVSPALALEGLRVNFWPRARADGHSHRMTYVGVFVALAIITIVEVLLTIADLPFAVTGPLVALSTAKVLLVVMYFMHLRYDSRWYAGIFVFTIPFAALVVTVLALA